MPPEVAEVFGRISLFLRNTTAIEDNAPDDSQLALIETASTPSHSPVSAATLNEPTVQAATDARYTILEKDNSSIKVYLEYDDIGLVQAAMHLNIALNSGLARLKRRAAMLPRSKRDEKPHMVHSDWFAETHTAAIYYDGKILTCKCKSPPDALEQAQKLKELVQFSSQK
ncbi:hypothetical protein PSHT_09323 [Puccinia striiformis]|uniref:Uncharacterized protein n=1 Tax=Puccinia striiformis TaxID=27350 RepID=A0A2S4VHX4_9BASI|nr:hypothetical protein PSHT_09323 [Puccinia striiformis]